MSLQIIIIFLKVITVVKDAIEWKKPWHSWIIRVLYMEMKYSEPQTPLFPPSYVNLVNKKDH